METPKILIACRIFENELQAILPSDADTQILWVETALHVDFSRLEKRLRECLSSARATGGSIRLHLGEGCHPQIDFIRKEYQAEMPWVRNCIEAFLGEKLKEAQKNSTMIMTPGWVRTWPDMMKALGWDEVDLRNNLGKYHKILIMDAGIDPLTDEEILCFFDLVQVPIEIEHLDLCNFRVIVTQLLK